MRHGKKFNHLGRTAPHRKAMLSNMASSLILHKRIVTTVAKAKALRKYVEPLITRAKDDTTHSRRMVFRHLQNKESVNELFSEISERVVDRAGGYTRILKTGNRLGDNASMCVIELVDYNENMLKEAKPKKSKTRRSRRGKSAAATAAAAAPAAEVVEEVVEEVAESAETTATEVEDVVEEVTEVAADTADEVEDAAEQVEEVVEEVAEQPEVEATTEEQESESEESNAEEE